MTFGNLTVVFAGPALATHQHVRASFAQHFFHPKERIVRHVDFLHILLVKLPFHGSPVPLLNLVGGHRPTSYTSDEKDFFGPTGQIPCLERAMFQGRPYPLSHTSLVQTIPHGAFVGACHSVRGQADASMRVAFYPQTNKGNRSKYVSIFKAVNIHRSATAALLSPWVEKCAIPLSFKHFWKVWL